MPTPYTLDLTATQVNAAVNKAHDSLDPVSQGSTKLVEAGAIYDAINTQASAKLRAMIGWGFYSDSTYTSGSPLNSNNAKTQITIDGLGATTETGYLPTGVTNLWSSNKITPAVLGDSYDLRLDFTAAPTGVSDYAEVLLDIGTGGSPINIVSRTVTFAKAGATSVSIGFPIFALSTFMANGGTLYFDTSVSGDNIDIYDISLFLKRDFTNSP